MHSVRRLARLLAGPGEGPSGARSTSVGSFEPNDVVEFASFGEMPVVVQKRGIDRGRLVRVDGLGLVVRPKRPFGSLCGADHGQ